MNLEADGAYLKLAVPDLKDFLLSGQLFWPIGSIPTALGEPGADTLSIGGTLVALARYQAARPAAAEPYVQQVADVRKTWRANWDKKAAKEFTARVKLWSQAVDEILQPGAGRSKLYLSRIRLRVMLEFLSQNNSEIPAGDVMQLVLMDKRLQASLQDGEFVWEPEVKAAFPEQPFWYLYRTVSS